MAWGTCERAARIAYAPGTNDDATASRMSRGTEGRFPLRSCVGQEDGSGGEDGVSPVTGDSVQGGQERCVVLGMARLGSCMGGEGCRRGERRCQCMACIRDQG